MRALVTGSSRGIGRAIALKLAEDGMDVAVHYNTGEDGALEVAKLIEKMGRKAYLFQADFTDVEQAVALAEAAISRFGGLDVLVNNAGIYNRKRFQELEEEDWHYTMTINLHSPFYICKMVVPVMQEAGYGRIVNIASILALTGSSQGVDYSAAKSGILGLTKGLAREVAKDGITVNAVASGAVETDIIADDTPEKRKEREKLIPVGRVGQPEDIAAVVSFLASEKAGYITGHTFNANGGQLML
jgi:3-oxoacyl-[acyl-carrier protein] reductase